MLANLQQRWSKAARGCPASGVAMPEQQAAVSPAAAPDSSLSAQLRPTLFLLLSTLFLWFLTLYQAMHIRALFFFFGLI